VAVANNRYPLFVAIPSPVASRHKLPVGIRPTCRRSNTPAYFSNAAIDPLPFDYIGGRMRIRKNEGAGQQG
jgi:hypothetical protein